MSSLWNRSGTIERYADDLRAAGAKAYFFNGGTTTPLVVFRDSGEASAFPVPLVADADGRWPDVFVPYITSYDVLVKTADDVQLTFSQQIPNPDPVELSVTVDPVNTVVTGMIHAELVNTTKIGYVRLNGKTMGNSASSSVNAERNNDDTLNLFTYLWNNLGNAIAPVSGGRGGSAAADFTANKTITLPNCQGAVLMGLDDMGGTAGGFFTGLTFAVGSAILAGSRTGANGTTMTLANMPAHSHSGTTQTEGAHTHTGTTGVESVSHTHSGTTGVGSAHSHGTSALTAVSGGAHSHLMVASTGTIVALSAGLPISINSVNSIPADYGLVGRSAAADVGLSGSAGAHTHTISGSTDTESVHTHSFTSGAASVTHTHTFTTGVGSLHSHTFTTDTQGTGTAFNNLPRSVLVTWFIKL